MTERVDQSLEFAQAKRIAFQFLKVRNRSEVEIRQKFSQKKINQEVVEQTIAYLANLKLINDRQFARDWISMRLSKPYGLKRIFFELRQKGIKDDLIKEEFERMNGIYNEQNAITLLAQKRLAKYKNLELPKAKRRVFEFLSRRGFSLDSIKEAIEHL